MKFKFLKETIRLFLLSILIILFYSNLWGLTDPSELMQKTQKSFSLNTQNKPLKEIIEEINLQYDVKIVGLQERENDLISISLKENALEKIIKRLLKYLDENNYAFEYTKTKLKRVSVLPKAKTSSSMLRPMPMETAKNEALKEKDKAVKILKINSGTQAESLDLKKDDLIIEYDGNRIRSASQLVAAVKKKTPEDTVEMVVIREQQPIRIMLNGGLIGVNVLTVIVPKSELGQ